MSALLHILLCLVLAQPPNAADAELSERQRQDLAAAQDDREFREQAFYALIEHVRGWKPPHSPADLGASIRLAPDFEAMTDRPGEFRGDLCRITGELLQQTALGPPYEGVSEWFVRADGDGTPVIVYVALDDTTKQAAATAAQAAASQADAAPRFSDRQHVQVDARFYKRMRLAARDGRMRAYPAFVGRFPIALATPASASAPVPAVTPHRGLDLLGVLAGPMVLLVLVFFGLRVWVSRKSRAVEAKHALSSRWPGVLDDEVDDAAGLPDDPAEALAELKRRAQARRD